IFYQQDSYATLYYFPTRRSSDLDNELWLTSSDLGIVYYETNSFNRVTFSEGRRFAFSSIAYDPISGTFWCGTWGSGLVNLSPNRSEEHTSELQSRENIVCRLLIE